MHVAEEVCFDVPHRQVVLTIPKRLRLLSPRTADRRAVKRRLKITVLSGGPGAEREVSLKSGRAVAAALTSLGHAVHVADIGPGRLEALDVPADMVFIALHGTFGEDGQLQQILDRRGIRYCGSGAAASALAMDKGAAKRRFVQVGIETPSFEVVTPQQVEAAVQTWSPPVVVKPVDEGSSVDCRIVRDEATLRTVASEMARRYDQFLIERFVAGPELTVGVLGKDALPPIEIRSAREFYDYRAKYLDDDTQYLFDIDLPTGVLEEIQRLSVAAHRALGCRGFSRVDWLVDEADHRPFALEVNTIPGFTDHSLLPKAAARASLSFADLCQRIVELAWER